MIRKAIKQNAKAFKAECKDTDNGEEINEATDGFALLDEVIFNLRKRSRTATLLQLAHQRTDKMLRFHQSDLKVDSQSDLKLTYAITPKSPADLHKLKGSEKLSPSLLDLTKDSPLSFEADDEIHIVSSMAELEQYAKNVDETEKKVWRLATVCRGCHFELCAL